MNNIKKLSEVFYRFSTVKVALAGLFVFLLFSVFTLPGQNALTTKYAQGSGSPDTSLIYSGKMIYHMAELYGEEGRAAYLHARWTFDLAFPFVYTFFYLTSISWLLSRNAKMNSRWRVLNLIPFAAMIFDLLENSMTSLVFKAFPLHQTIGEVLAPLFTLFKWIFFFPSTLLLLILFLILVIDRIKKRT